eukprot:scaffold39379_cov44-Attheya_sp.AAC.2
MRVVHNVSMVPRNILISVMLLSARYLRRAVCFSPSRSISSIASRPPHHRLGIFGLHVSKVNVADTASYNDGTADFSTLTVIQLRNLLREQGAPTSGTKKVLISKLLSSLAQPQQQQQRQTLSPPKSSRKEVIAPKKFSTDGGESSPKKVSPTRPSPRKSVTTKTLDIESTELSNAETTSTSVDANGFSKIHVPSELVKRLGVMGLTNPTPIQEKAIPYAIQGKDVMGLAQTGTGKTLAFGVPLVAQMMEEQKRPRPKAIRGLVLAPTRELANQIAVQLDALTKGTSINTFVVVGGQNINTQINKLKPGMDILVATPGRLIDLMDRGALILKDTSFLVLDEADMMLDMGFLRDLRKIATKLPSKRQTMLFSATMSKDINVVASSYLNNPVRVEAARAGKTADKITQELHFIAKADKPQKLLDLLTNHPEDRAIVFGRTKHGMEKLSKKLIAAGFLAGSIHGNKSQSQRDRAIVAFKSGDIKILVATDVAARGLDIPDVKHVYNYELPNVPEAYVHRIGRTARAGKEGAAIAFCSMEEMDDLLDIQKVTGLKIPVVSGTPWSKHETKREKDKMKSNKLNEQQKRRERSNGGDRNKKAGAGNTNRRYRS